MYYQKPIHVLHLISEIQTNYRKTNRWLLLVVDVSVDVNTYAEDFKFVFFRPQTDFISDCWHLFDVELVNIWHDELVKSSALIIWRAFSSCSLSRAISFCSASIRLSLSIAWDSCMSRPPARRASLCPPPLGKAACRWCS